MKYIIPVIFRFLYAIFISIAMVSMYCLAQIAYTLWTFKFQSFNKDWNHDRNFWEYDANDYSFEQDPEKIYPSIWHWAASLLPKLPRKKPIEINQEPFLKA